MYYKLPYVREEVEDRITPYEFTEVIGINQYNDAYLRDRVVFRLDLLYALSDRFEESTLKTYRGLIYNLVVGHNRNKEKISQLFTALYTDDEKFRNYIGEIVYFDTALKANSLYSLVLKYMHEDLRKRKTFLIEEMTKKNIKFITDSHLYLYASIKDENVIVSVPEGYGEEVVSCAKVWKGTFKRY